MAFRVESHAEPIPGYRLLERLGGGGFGEVWKCEAPGGIHKAIKLVFGNLESVGDDEVRARQELKALNRVKTVRHPYILSLERYDIIEGRLLIVMELADKNLWDRFKECRAQGLPGLPRDELLRYLDEAAEALDLMNQEYQLQHLDIKPQNIFLVYNHIKVADFGLVKDLEGMRGVITGGITPVYAAPETFDGEVSRYCDQYSLAIVYQELLTGRRPFSGANVTQLVLQHLNQPPALDALPPGDRPAIARSLSKCPEERFPTCTDLVRALRAASGSGVLISPLPAEDMTPRPPYLPTQHGPLALPEGSPHQLATPSRNQTATPTPTFSVPAADEPPAAPRQAPPERTGEGLLFPALVIGVGGLGLTVLQRLRLDLAGRHGSAAALPHVRLLYLDTDPEAPRLAGQGPADAALGANEVLLARLNRQVHYLKQAPGRLRIDSWLDSKMIYRIPRQLVTNGLRALGRLAFMDNYRGIANRLQAELDACTDPEALDAALRQTRLGLRTTRPRVYVVAGLGGGTGGGMCLDLAYVLRRLLRQQGYERSEVVGLLLLPAAGKADGARGSLPAANAYAALTELHHFAVPQTTFTAHYDEAEKPLHDPAPPWDRCVLLPLSDEGNDPSVARQAADFLGRELAAPLGRVLDVCRPGRGLAAGPGGTTYQSFGASRFFWPRRTLLRRAGRALAHRLLKTWAAKDRGPVRGPARALLAEAWPGLGLDAERFVEQLQDACARELGKAPESAFAEVLAPLEAAARPTTSFIFRRTPDVDPAAVGATLEQLEYLVGRPEGSAGTSRIVPVLPGVLEGALKPLVAACEKKLVALALRLLDTPGLRLAGAAEVLDETLTKLGHVTERYEELASGLGRQSAGAFHKLHEIILTLQAAGRKTAGFTAEVVELVRSYPKWRYQYLLVRQVIQGCHQLAGRLTDLAREVDACRSRLAELLLPVSARGPQAAESEGRPGDGSRTLLPAGLTSVTEAVERILADVSDQEFRDLDRRIQETIGQHFTSLHHVCQGSPVLLKNLERAVRQESEAVAAGRLAAQHVVEMFFQHYPHEAEARTALAHAFEDAAPRLTPETAGRGGEVRVLAVPPGGESDRLRTLVHQALPAADLTAAASHDDIVFYREGLCVPLAELEQAGAAARDAYDAMQTAQDLTPHSRTDVTDWLDLRGS